jgi:RNA polymerase sigma factor (sigma-70 family)
MKKDKSNQFLSLIENNKGLLYKIANSYCKDSEDRKDLIQEMIIQLWKAFDGYNADFKYSTWMYRIALNVAISFYRKENSRKGISNTMTEGIFQLADTDLVDVKEAELGLLQEVIGQLRNLDKALMLLYLEEKSYREIAEIMGITETNVATKISRIKVVLKQKLTSAINQ